MNARRFNSNNKNFNKRFTNVYPFRVSRAYTNNRISRSNFPNKFQRKRFQRMQPIKPRFSYVFKRTKPNKSNNSRLSRQIDSLTKQMSRLTLSNSTNLNKGKKEVRTDKIMTPMYMAIHQSYLSLFPSSNKIVYVPVYTKISLQVYTNQTTDLLWFPYAVSFKNFDIDIKMNFLDEDYYANAVASLISVNPLSRLVTTYKMGTCNLAGSYRLVGATLKLYNTSSMLNRGGDYTIYKLNDGGAFPFAYDDEHQPTWDMIGEKFRDYTMQDFQQTTIKNNFSASDKAVYINEYNTNEGNNIFCNNSEYLGQTYTTQNLMTVFPREENATGNNIKYLLKFQPTTQNQFYTVEVWQLIELVPYPNTNLSNLCYNITHVLNKKAFDELCTTNPFSKI